MEHILNRHCCVQKTTAQHRSTRQTKSQTDKRCCYAKKIYAPEQHKRRGRVLPCGSCCAVLLGPPPRAQENLQQSTRGHYRQRARQTRDAATERHVLHCVGHTQRAQNDTRKINLNVSARPSVSLRHGTHSEQTLLRAKTTAQHP